MSFRTKALHFFVLSTYRQVTKSNSINLTDFGLRQNVKVLLTTQSLLWHQRTAVLLTYYRGMCLKLLNSSRLHCYSRRSQWKSTLRGLTIIIWSVESLLRWKTRTKWEGTVNSMWRSKCRHHLIAINYQQNQNLEPSWPSLISYFPNMISDDTCDTL